MCPRPAAWKTAADRNVDLAICAIARNEARYIEEWLAFHFLQGVGEILVFDNDSDDGTPDILARVGRHVPAVGVRWPSSFDHDQMQRDAYHEGTTYFAARASWVAFIDLDEFLFSARGRSLPEELAEFGAEVGAIAVGHSVFGSSGHAAYAPDLVTSRFVRCAGTGHPQSRWFKTIARPALIETFDSVHSVVLKEGSYTTADHRPLQRGGTHPGFADRATVGAILLNHYMVKSLEEYRWKQERARDKSIAERYTDEFFRLHDSIGNQVQNGELQRFSEPIRSMIANWRGG